MANTTYGDSTNGGKAIGKTYWTQKNPQHYVEGLSKMDYSPNPKWSKSVLATLAMVFMD
jgi:hypothetical protein